MEAAPIRNECDDMFANPPVVSSRSLLTSFRVRNFPFWNVKNGPCIVGCMGIKVRIALMGQRSVSLLAKRMVVPCLKGSVLDVLMVTWAVV